MAISKILHMNDCGKAFHGKHLKTAITYITVPEKTQNGRLVSAVNCQIEHAYEQMKSTKQKFGKIDKRQGYHIILSFQENETDLDIVFELAGRFVDEYLASNYEVIYAVHDNTSHPHAHIVFNSVSFRTGKKFHYKKGDWEREIQPITNRLCMEYGLFTIEFKDKTQKSRDAYQEWNVYRDGKFVWNKMVARDVDACILQSRNYDDFIEMLSDKGYEVKNANDEGKYLAVRPQGMKRFIRLKTLGTEYEEEQIRTRIREEAISEYQPVEKPRIVCCRVKKYNKAKLSGIQKKYYARLYRVGKLKKKAYSAAWKYMDEIKKMHRLQEQYNFLVRHDIHSFAELAFVEDCLTDKKRETSAEKGRLYRADSKNNELYKIHNDMKELLECEHAYIAGDSYFADEHEKYMELAKQLNSMGYSYEEVTDIKEHYHGELVRLKELECAAAKELRVADSIRRDYLRPNAPERDIEEEKIIEEMQDKQPIR